MNEQPVTVPDPYQMPTQPSPSGKSRLGLWIGLGVGGALLLAGIIVGVVLLLMSGSPKSIASAYLSAIEKDDQTKIRELSGESPDPLTNRAREEMKASKGFTYDGEKDDKDKGMVVRFKAGEDKKTIIAVTVKDKRITKLVINTGKPVKADDEKKADSQDDKQSAAPNSQAASTCLTVKDFREFGHLEAVPMRLRDGKTISLLTFFFEADSAQSAFPDLAKRDVATIANLYKKHADKKFTIELQGSTSESSTSSTGTKLANERAAKVKNDLVANGVPEARITVVAPKIGDSTASRSVNLFFSMDQSCSE